jgi:TfuA protein
MLDTVIYLGPSMSRSEASSILQADYLPPICRGDLAKLPEDVRTVGIIDGEFFQSLAVSPKEIVALLEKGMKVFGAASIGALRAVETEKFGTIGVGEIFCMFRDGILDGDDEVALVYDARSYRHLSEPLVNIRRALAIALEEKVIDEVEMERLVAQMKSRYFPDRSHKYVQSLCPRLASFFDGKKMPDVKYDDARLLLLAISDMKRSCT